MKVLDFGLAKSGGAEAAVTHDSVRRGICVYGVNKNALSPETEERAVVVGTKIR